MKYRIRTEIYDNRSGAYHHLKRTYSPSGQVRLRKSIYVYYSAQDITYFNQVCIHIHVRERIFRIKVQNAILKTLTDTRIMAQECLDYGLQ